MDEADEPTLTQDSAEDVALDMDRDDDGFLFAESILTMTQIRTRMHMGM